MIKWNRVPSICLRSPTGWRARLRVPWLNPRWSSSAWAGFRGEDGWCIWEVSSDTSLNGPLKASAGRREALIPHLPHLAPFTEHTCTLPTAFPTHIADGQYSFFPFLHKYFQDVQKKMSALTVSVCHLKEFAPANMDACVHIYLKFVFYFADACQTQSPSKC